MSTRHWLLCHLPRLGAQRSSPPSLTPKATDSSLTLLCVSHPGHPTRIPRPTQTAAPGSPLHCPCRADSVTPALAPAPCSPPPGPTQQPEGPLKIDVTLPSQLTTPQWLLLTRSKSQQPSHSHRVSRRPPCLGPRPHHPARSQTPTASRPLPHPSHHVTVKTPMSVQGKDRGPSPLGRKLRQRGQLACPGSHG